MEWTNEQLYEGYLDYNREAIVLIGEKTTEIEGGDTATIRVKIVAKWENLQPYVEIQSPMTNSVFECDSDNGAILELSGTTQDFGGSVDKILWVLDRRIVGEAESISCMVPLGDHKISMFVVDNEGLSNRDGVLLSVEDTTPPEIGSIDQSVYCVAPPNHKYIRLVAGEDVLADVVDACDPDPDVRFESVSSNQPDDAIGDGNTSGDIILFDDYVCLRAERAGQLLDGREYTIGLRATDVSGNSTQGSITIRITHDQRDHDCMPLPPSCFVPRGDEERLCPIQTEEEEDGLTTKEEEDGTIGCRIVHGSSGDNWLWLSIIASEYHGLWPCDPKRFDRSVVKTVGGTKMLWLRRVPLPRASPGPPHQGRGVSSCERRIKNPFPLEGGRRG
ncbi:MAG: hypothetical protein JXR96_30850, partial [Deltaproteobacteria bacterium]|nr:hypothetical protein [Deltaproteobacteria bacterium]